MPTIISPHCTSSLDLACEAICSGQLHTSCFQFICNTMCASSTCNWPILICAFSMLLYKELFFSGRLKFMQSSTFLQGTILNIVADDKHNFRWPCIYLPPAPCWLYRERVHGTSNQICQTHGKSHAHMSKMKYFDWDSCFGFHYGKWVLPLICWYVWSWEDHGVKNLSNWSRAYKWIQTPKI